MGNMLQNLRAGTLYSEDRHMNGEVEGPNLPASKRNLGEDNGRTRHGDLRWEMQKLCGK